MSRLLVALLTLMPAACVQVTYAPPPLDDLTGQYSVIVERPFDDTWAALIDHAARTYFTIDDFEKDSGLLTLSFGVGNPADYVVGGTWTFEDKRLRRREPDFDGDYVTYLQRQRNGSLQARMNVVARPLDPARTRIVVNTRYVYRSDLGTWVFQSGGYAELEIADPPAGTPPSRILRPTHKAEREFIEAVRRF